MERFDSFETPSVSGGGKVTNFDRPKLERLKKAMARAKRDNSPSFKLDDDEYLVTYAQYIVEYLDGRLVK